MTNATCNCEDSKAWKARALAAELAMRFAHRNLERLLDNLDRVMKTLPTESVSTLEDEAAGQTVYREMTPEFEQRIMAIANGEAIAEPLTPETWRRIVNWMADRLRNPKETP